MLVTRLSSQANRTAGRLAQQGDALLAAAIDWPNLFEEKASSARSDRSALVAALDYARTGDYLTVSKLGRLARCGPHLSALDRRDDSTPQGAFLFRVLSPSGCCERCGHPNRGCRGWRSAVGLYILCACDSGLSNSRCPLEGTPASDADAPPLHHFRGIDYLPGFLPHPGCVRCVR